MNEETEEIPFCGWTPYTQPFKFYGRCPADELTEIQLIKSTILRQTMDNIYTVNNNTRTIPAIGLSTRSVMLTLFDT